MKALLTAWGVDYDQWKALTIVALKLDFRIRTVVQSGAKKSDNIRRRIIAQILINVMLGGALAAFVPIISDRFLAAIFITTYVMFMVATTMLVDHNAAIISPSDYNILGFRPITSRTYFAARLTNVLVYTLAMSTAVSLLPALVFLIRHGLVAGAALALGLAMAALFVSLTIAMAYAWFMNIVGAARLRRMVSYVQLIAGFAVYGGYILIAEVSQLLPDTIDPVVSRWLLLFPPAWFASYAEAATSASARHWLTAVGSLAVLGVLFYRLRGRLSLEYAERLSELSALTAPASKRPDTDRAGRLNILKRETRAVAILVRSHFRHDLRFRMGVLGVLPLTLLYIVMGLRNGNSADAAGPAGRVSLWGVIVPAMMLPVILKGSMAASESFRASWIFFASPADRARLIVACKNVLVGFFVVPYLLLLGIIITLFGVEPGFALFLIVLTGLMSHLVMLIATHIQPELPFSRPAADKAESSRRVLGSMLVIGAASGLIPLIARLAYGKATATLVILGVIVLVSVALELMLRERIREQSAKLEFRG